MKKLIVAAVVMLLSAAVGGGNVKAQSYHGELSGGWSIYPTEASVGCIGLHTVQGVQFGSHFSTGMGLGAECMYDFDGGAVFCLPVYVDMKVYFGRRKVTPFITLDAGYAFGADDEMIGCIGAYYAPSFGLRYRKMSFQLGLEGYRDMCFLQFKIGVTFGR